MGVRQELQKKLHGDSNHIVKDTSGAYSNEFLAGLLLMQYFGDRKKSTKNCTSGAVRCGLDTVKKKHGTLHKLIEVSL